MPALGLLFLLLIFAGGWVLHIRHQEKKLHLRVAELLAEAEASRPQVPEAENAAPLYRQAFALHQDRKLQEELLAKAKEEGEAFDFLSQEVTGYLEKNRPFLLALKKAAELQKCTFRPNFLAHDEGGLFDGSHGVRDSVGFMRLATDRAAAAGRLGEALELTALYLRLGDHFGRDETLMCRMVEKAVEGLAARRLQFTLNRCDPDAAALLGMLRAIDASSLNRRDLSGMIRLSKVSTMRSMEMILRGEDLKFTDPDEDAFPDNGQALKQAGRIGRWTGLAFAEFRNMDATYDRCAEAARQPHPNGLNSLIGIRNEVKQRCLERPMTGGLILTTTSIGAMTICLEAAVQNSTWLDAARLGLGCRLYRLKFGAYPEALAELAAKLPEHFKELPADPFTGKPFLYKRTATGCLVWSVGKDRADDGGDAKKDIVFELKK